MRQRIVQAQKPWSQNAIASDYLQFQYQDAVGTTVINYTGKLSGSPVSGSLAPQNSMSTAYNDRGFITPLAGSGNSVPIKYNTNLPFENFLRLDTLGVAGEFLFYGTLKFSGTPALTTEIFFAYGSTSVRGGYFLQITTGGNRNCQLSYRGINGTSASVSRSFTNVAGDSIPFIALINSDSIYMAVNGNWANSSVASVAGQTQRGLLLTTDGIGLLCSVDVLGLSPINPLNASATASTNEWAHHGLTIIRRDSRFTTSQMITLAEEHAANPREIPPSLNGL